MSDRGLPTAAKVALWGAAVVVALAAGFVPRWWENRLYRQAEAIAGVEAPVRAGQIADARKRIDRGQLATQTFAVLGAPSLQSSSDGQPKREIWTYYYADGTMVLNLTGGVVERVSVTFGPPVIRKSKRPR